jgi:hypothetical protein
MKSVTLKVVEPLEVILGDLLFLMEKAICALVFPQIYSVNLCTITFKGEKVTPKLDIICERYWLLEFGQPMVPPYTNRYFQST